MRNCIEINWGKEEKIIHGAKLKPQFAF